MHWRAYQRIDSSPATLLSLLETRAPSTYLHCEHLFSSPGDFRAPHWSHGSCTPASTWTNPCTALPGRMSPGEKSPAAMKRRRRSAAWIREVMVRGRGTARVDSISVPEKRVGLRGKVGAGAERSLSLEFYVSTSSCFSFYISTSLEVT